MADSTLETSAPAMAPAPGAPVAESFFSWRDKLAFLIAAVLCFIGYWFTIQPSVGLEDSGEFLTAAYNLGVPHPPGYPIWTILSWVWYHLIPFGNIAWRVNLMSVAFGAVAVGLVAMMISKTGHLMGARVGFLHEMDERVTNLIVLASSVSAALMLAFSPVMWSQSVISEVYALNAFFLILTLYYLYRWSFNPERRWRLYLAAFVWGVSLTNHQTLVLLTIAFPAFVWFVDRRLGRDVMIPILAVIVLMIGKMVITKDSMIHQGAFSAAGLLIVGVGAAVWLYYLLTDTDRLMRQWPQVLVLYGCVLLGLSLYAYMHLASCTNPPMNWGFTSTWQGFVHHFTRGQYERVMTNRDLLKFWGQLNMFFDDLQSQFNIFYALLALFCLFFYRDLDKRDRKWLNFLLIAFLFLGLGFIFLSNPGFEKQKQFTDRVFFLPGHVLYSMWIGYGMILGLGYFLSSKPASQRAAPVFAAVIFLLPLWSVKRNWADNEQYGHYFGYEFGYRMFKPGGGYPEMDRDAVLYGGTDPGRFVPTHMIFVESLAPSRAKTHYAKFPDSATFDRRDVYIITQNALADSTYMSYIRDHYDYSRPDPKNPQTLANRSGLYRFLFQNGWHLLGRDETYPKNPIWIPSEQDSQAAFSQYVDELRRRQPLPEEQVQVEGGRVSVQGVQGVMAINGILTKMIFDKNKDKHSFYVEESYVIPWMYPYMTPYGIILKINKDELPGPDRSPETWQQIIAIDRAYWEKLFVELKDDPRFHRDDVAQKTFSKLRSAIGGLYAYRGLIQEAELAYRQSIQLCPDSPEANFRLAQLYVQTGKYQDAVAVLEDYQKRDEYNTKIAEAIKTIKDMQQQLLNEQQLEQQYGAEPGNVSVAFQLVKVYATRGRLDAMDNVVNGLLARPDLPANNLMELAQLYAQLKRLDRVGQILNLFVQRFPNEPIGWFNLAAVAAVSGNCDGAAQALQRALALDTSGNVRQALSQDQRFHGCRDNPNFQAVMATQVGGANPAPFSITR